MATAARRLLAIRQTNAYLADGEAATRFIQELKKNGLIQGANKNS